MSTHKQRRALVNAVQVCCMGFDHEELTPIFPNEEELGWDDGRVGGEARLTLAANIRRLKTFPKAYADLLASIRKVRNSMLRNPKRWRMGRPSISRRRHAKTIQRKAVPAKRHEDCCYCGWGLGIAICGECREAGIDGPVIRGTEAKKASTYVRWN